MKQSFWKTISGPFSVASVYVGALVGPALVAGTYATVFYLSNGCNSLWLPFLACGIVGLMCLSAAEIIRHYKIYEYGALPKRYTAESASSRSSLISTSFYPTSSARRSS